jgi:tRNA(Ile)-lysidine synthase
MIRKLHQILNYLLHSSVHPLFCSSKIAVAVSGGSDSMALLLLAQQAGYQIVALTVDHQLRAESAIEAQQVAAWMAAYNIPHQILIWQHEGEVQGNLQAAARHARYALITQYCNVHSINTLLVGHTQDDQAETIAMRQARESGAVGLAGMSAISEVRGVRLLRPLLAFQRQELREFLQQQGQGWIDDPSNENTDFDRIRIRKELVQDDARYDSLLKLGREMAKERQKIEQEYADFVARAVTISAPQRLEIALAAWTALSVNLRLFALSRMLLAVSGRPYPPRYRELQQLSQQMQSPAGKATLGKCVIEWSGSQIKIWPEGVESASSTPHICERGKQYPLAKPLVSMPFYCIQDAL